MLVTWLILTAIVVDISADGDSWTWLIVPVAVGYRSGLDTRSNFIVLENSNGSLAYNARIDPRNSVCKRFNRCR